MVRTKDRPSPPWDKPALATLSCAGCGHAESFVVEVTECLLMFPDGVVLQGDQGPWWDRRSHCSCPVCGRTGTVADFEREGEGHDGA